MLRITTLCLICTTLFACSHHHPTLEGSQEVFATDIKTDGSKRFNFTLMLHTERKRERQNRSPQGGSGKEGRKKQGKPRREGSRSGTGTRPESKQGDADEKLREKALERLVQKIEENGYCRNGYIELDYFALRGQVQIRGECQESASEQDREKWQAGSS